MAKIEKTDIENIKILEKEITESGAAKLFEKMELPLSKVLAKMELEGISLDVKMLNDFSIELTKELVLITSKIHDLAGEEFNIASPKQLGEVLYNELKIAALKKTKKPILTLYSFKSIKHLI